MGLFQEIAKRPVSIDSLAEKTRYFKPAVDAWCTAALSLGFVKERNKRLYLPGKMRSLLLDQQHPDYLAGQFSYIALRSLDFEQLEDLFRSGKTSPYISHVEVIDEATAWDHYAFLKAVKKERKLDSLLSKGCHVLDVGCGTGKLIERMLKIYPSSTFTGIEPHLKSFVQAKKMSDRHGQSVTVLQTSGESMNFDNEFDLVYLGESLYATKDKKKVLSNCRRSLTKDGTLAVVEGLLPESRNDMVQEENKLIMAMQLDFVLQGNNFLRTSEMKQLLADSGFSRIKLTDLGGAAFLVTATK